MVRDIDMVICLEKKEEGSGWGTNKCKELRLARISVASQCEAAIYQLKSPLCASTYSLNPHAADRRLICNKQRK